ncbi:CocE/NonD family hydrolase [Streptomyces sp. NPDC006307]|uniref:CocE/NonD family hydrolase n=1 Tax=Streptomyces sp. NPDC006307 TaxID=3156748 RepID=UPI0033AA2243
MRFRTSFPYETTHEDVRIALPDSTRLYGRVWRPLTDEPVPALLEYAPDRLTDATAARDAQRHPWYAGHGYASVRVDARGYGNSEGVPGGGAHDLADDLADDLAEEIDEVDEVVVLNWLADQPWCSGRVGMIGIGPGAHTALRVAALAPTPGPLGAVVAVCAEDTSHGHGHSHGYSHSHSARLARAACPPDPHHVGDLWREMWLARLEALDPSAEHTHLPYAPEAIAVPVLAVAGRHAPHRDTVLRLVERLPRARVRGILGPWPYAYPDQDLPPGPAIGFLQETLRWWDHHLKGVTNDVMAEPLLRSWISSSHRPATAPPELPGRWVGDDAWPSPRVTPVAYALQGPPVLVRSPLHTGLDGGRPVPRGGDADLPPDQRADDACSACFDFPVPEDGPPVEILGRPRVTLAVRPHGPTAQVIARLCDVAPGGASTLIARGTDEGGATGTGNDNGNNSSTAYVFDLSHTAHSFAPGHRVRLAVSSAYWPMVRPHPEAAGFTLDPVGSALELPLHAPTGSDETAFEPPEQAEQLGVSHPATLDEAQRPALLLVRDVARGEWRLEADTPPEGGGGGGTRVHPDGLEFTEDAVQTYTLTDGDPLSARSRSEWKIRFHRPDPEQLWNVTVDTRSETACEAGGPVTTDEVMCAEGPEVLFHRTWVTRVGRTAG